jgi:5-methylcytosine-specific restriction protein A
MLKGVIEKLLHDYPVVSQENFKNHPFASYLRNDVPNRLSNSLNLLDIYSIKASPGNGAWAWIPWIAVFNKLITDSVTSGIFLVYLFRADFSGVYLSLSQGTASQKKIYGLGVSRELLRRQARLLRSVVENKPDLEICEEIDLKLETIPKETTGRRLGKAYEACNIFATYYSRDSLPESQKLAIDLLEFMKMYDEIIDKQPFDSYENGSNTDTEEVWIEDLTKYRIHRRVERNQALCKKAKEIHEYVCKACGFNFEYRYGEVGKKYIEAHHIVPISSLEKTKVKLDPAKDFTVVCSNCHRMIHRIKPTPTLEEFAKIIRR